MDVPVYKKLVLFRSSAWPDKTWDVFTPEVTADVQHDAFLVCMSLFVFFSLDFYLGNVALPGIKMLLQRSLIMVEKQKI